MWTSIHQVRVPIQLALIFLHMEKYPDEPPLLNVRRLRKVYMVNKEGELQKSPPDLYPQITPAAWTTFIAYHTSEEFLAKSEKNKANISKKETVYTGSRGGYRKLTEIAIQIKKDKGIENPEIGRHEVWMLGHKDKDGKMKTPYDQIVHDRCLTYEKEYAEGKFKSSGTDDILGRAIGKPEHPGRVRGVSSHVGITKVFRKSKRKTTTEYVKSLEQRVICGENSSLKINCKWVLF